MDENARGRQAVGRIPPHRWVESTVWVVVGVWATVVLGLTNPPSERLLSSQLFVTVAGGIGFTVLAFRATVVRPLHRALMVGLGVGVLANVVTSDWAFALDHGVVFSGAAVGALVGAAIAPVLRRPE